MLLSSRCARTSSRLTSTALAQACVAAAGYAVHQTTEGHVGKAQLPGLLLVGEKIEAVVEQSELQGCVVGQVLGGRLQRHWGDRITFIILAPNKTERQTEFYHQLPAEIEISSSRLFCSAP